MAVSISLAITQNSQSITNNTSSVTVAVTAKWTYGSWNNTGNATGSITIDGTKYNFTGVTFNAGRKTTGSQVIMTKTATVKHNTDGTKTLSCSAVLVSGVSSGTVTCSGSKKLTTIPRATTPTLSSTSVFMESQVTIGLDRANSSFTHDLAYSFAGGSYVTFKPGAGTSYTWTLPDLASKIPKATSGTLTIRCITKNGSTTIGTKTVTMTAKVPTTAAYMPTISVVSHAEATAGLAAQFGAYVQKKSKVKATITAAGAKGSTISAYSTTFQGLTYTGSSWTSGVLASSGSLNMVTTVTDSRGRKATKTTTVSGILPYAAPAINTLQVYRINDSGAATTEGTKIAVRYKYGVASLDSKNTASLVVEYKRSTEDDTAWAELFTNAALSTDTTATPSDVTFSVDYQYDIRATLTDWFGGKGDTYNTVLPSGAVILDIAANGKGLAIGKTSEYGGFESGWKARLWAEGANVLWQGSAAMAASDVVTLSEPVSMQSYGIVLGFSAYTDGKVQDYDFAYHFVPKHHVTKFPGKGVSIFLTNSTLNVLGNKYLYISDDQITGHANNWTSGTTANGLIFKNNYYMLRCVIGV